MPNLRPPAAAMAHPPIVERPADCAPAGDGELTDGGRPAGGYTRRPGAPCAVAQAPAAGADVHHGAGERQQRPLVGARRQCRRNCSESSPFAYVPWARRVGPGPQLMAALELHGLAFGRYQVFHRKHVDGRSLFCVASLIEPGTFDIAAMAEPGVSRRHLVCRAAGTDRAARNGGRAVADRTRLGRGIVRHDPGRERDAPVAAARGRIARGCCAISDLACRGN